MTSKRIVDICLKEMTVILLLFCRAARMHMAYAAAQCQSLSIMLMYVSVAELAIS